MLQMRDQWLAALAGGTGDQNTQRAYAHDWHRFYVEAGRPLPADVDRQLVTAWLSSMRGQRLAPATINRRLAALSSYFEYLSAAGCGRADNPFHIRREKVARYGRSRFPSYEQVEAIMAQIDPGSARGLRDRAIIAGLTITTRRRAEWLRLRWGDIQPGPGEWSFTYLGKGGQLRRQVLPDAIRDAIIQYLRAVGHYPPNSRDYLFVDLRPPIRWHRHLCYGYVNKLLRRYGRGAGLADELLHAHGLRHAGARHRYRQGASLHDLQNILGHANMATTEIYIRQVLEEPVDRQAGAFASLLTPHSR